MRRLALVTVVLAATGCHAAGPPSATRGPDCLTAWNAPANERFRAEVAGRFRFGDVSQWMVSHGPATGCSYLFRTKARYRTLSGRWDPYPRLEWDGPPLSHAGRWSPAQQSNHAPNAVVTGEGRLVMRFVSPQHSRRVGARACLDARRAGALPDAHTDLRVYGFALRRVVWHAIGVGDDLREAFVGCVDAVWPAGTKRPSPDHPWPVRPTAGFAVDE